MRAITTTKAQAALAAVVARYQTFLEPIELPAEPETWINGEHHPATKAMTLSPCYSPPELVENFRGEGHWAIVWEDGPFEWAYRAPAGGFDDETAIEIHAMGGTPTPEEPIPFPRGVFAEPWTTYALGLYPA